MGLEVPVQVRAHKGNGFRLQGKGPKTNRDYGVAEEYTMDAGAPFPQWLSKTLASLSSVFDAAKTVKPSLHHGSSEHYHTATAELLDDGTVRLTVERDTFWSYGAAPLNHPHGAVVRIRTPKALRPFLEACISASL